MFPLKINIIEKFKMTYRGVIALQKKLSILAGLLIIAGIAGYAGKNLWQGDAVVKVGYSENLTQTSEPQSDRPTQNNQTNPDNPDKKTSAVVSKNEDQKKTAATDNLSNKKCGWGIKRADNHQQPEMPTGISNTLSRYNAYWIGNPTEKSVYLTFDEGYENGYTAKILDILKAQDVKAAFFITGHYLKSQPELVKRMAEEGHIIGNHTVNHPSLPDLTNEQIKKETEELAQDFTGLTGKKMVYLRAPKGEYSERTLAETNALGYYNIFWSLALVDWIPLPGGPEESFRTVTDNLHNGAVILLHAVSKDNTEALERIIKDAKAQGYTFKTLDELVKK